MNWLDIERLSLNVLIFFILCYENIIYRHRWSFKEISVKLSSTKPEAGGSLYQLYQFRLPLTWFDNHYDNTLGAFMIYLEEIFLLMWNLPFWLQIMGKCKLLILLHIDLMRLNFVLKLLEGVFVFFGKHCWILILQF